MIYKFLKEIDSTNNYCKEFIDELSDKTVCYTFKQNSGRGRFNRIWVDLGCDNLFLSIVLKPSLDMRPVYSNLTQYTSLVLAETFSDYGVIPKIKWPNDILVNGKKISGILAETVFRNNELKGIVIGVGINLNTEESKLNQIDKPVTSLNIEINEYIDKNKFLNKFVDKFFDNYDRFLKAGFVSIKRDYETYINFLGKEITIHNWDKSVTGIAQEITPEGAIIIGDNQFFTGDIL